MTTAGQSTNPSIPHFFLSLAALFRRVEATDVAGASLGFTRGFSAAVDVVGTQTAGSHKIIFIGNGGSAAIASHQAIDYWKNGGMRAIAFNDSSLLTCIGNDFGYAHVFEKPIMMFADDGDVLIAISSSGQSENIHRGVSAARGRRCTVITMSGFHPQNPLRQLGDINFYAPSHSYGEVEITHLAICHAVLDFLIERRITTPESRL